MKNVTEKRNEFLVEMHELESRFHPVLDTLGLFSSQDNLATIALSKALKFADRFEENAFFENLTGSLLIEYFWRLSEECVKTLEEEVQKSFLSRSLQMLFWRGEIPSYLDTCTFIEESSFADLSELFAELLTSYIVLHEDMTIEEMGYILAVVQEEVTTLEDEKVACSVIDATVSILLEEDSFKEKIEYSKILQK